MSPGLPAFPAGLPLTLPSLPSAALRPAAKHVRDTCTHTCAVCLLNIIVYVIPLITFMLCLVPGAPVLCCLSCVLRVVVLFVNSCCLLLHAMPRPPQSPKSCILSTPICPFTGSVWGQKEKPFYKNINANLISAPLPPPPSSD